MRNPSYLVLSRHNIYYFRWPIPRQVRRHGKTSHIKISLQTREPREALRLATILQDHAYHLLKHDWVLALDYMEVKRLVETHFIKVLEDHRRNIDRYSSLLPLPIANLSNIGEQEQLKALCQQAVSAVMQQFIGYKSHAQESPTFDAVPSSYEGIRRTENSKNRLDKTIDKFIAEMNKTGASLFNNMLYKLPILGSLLWLAFFASKRRSEDRRLQQEYAHKEALAKSYQGFKQQIDALQAKDEELTKRLLETAIGAIALNASSTLDGKHGDKMPILDLTEKGLDKVAEIVKLIKDR